MAASVDGQCRPKGRLLSHQGGSLAPQGPQISLTRQKLSVKDSALQTVLGTLGLHKNPSPSHSLVVCILRRSPHHGRLPSLGHPVSGEDYSGPHPGSVYSEPEEVGPQPHTGSHVHGPGSIQTWADCTYWRLGFRLLIDCMQPFYRVGTYKPAHLFLSFLGLNETLPLSECAQLYMHPIQWYLKPH